MSRSSKLLGMAARVAGHEVSQQISERIARSADKLGAKTIARRVEQARVIATALSELKGAAMKAGQFLSVDAADLLPPEAVAVLSKVQSEGEPMPFDIIYSVLSSELGSEKLQRIENLAQKPTAAASIGQVHAGYIDGSKVALKVQYPDIASSIPSDLAVLRRLAATLLTLSGRKIALDEVFEELQTILELEADYKREAACMRIYRDKLSQDNRYHVPQPYIGFSTSRVVTMSWMEGTSLGQWLLVHPSKEERCRVADWLLDLYCREFFEWGFVQTDPNPGNFMMMNDGRIGILDFGATLTYPSDFREKYIELLKTIESKDDERLIEASIEFGLLDAREDKEVRNAYSNLMKTAAEPFELNHQPFAFGSTDYQAKARSVVFDFLQRLKYTPPPRKLIFLHRKLGGLFNILKRLDAEVNLRPYWEQMLAYKGPFDEISLPEETDERAQSVDQSSLNTSVPIANTHPG